MFEHFSYQFYIMFYCEWLEYFMLFVFLIHNMNLFNYFKKLNRFFRDVCTTDSVPKHLNVLLMKICLLIKFFP